MKHHYSLILKENDKRVDRGMRMQVLDRENRFYGGVLNDEEVVMAKYTLYRAMEMIGAYCNELSRHYRSEKVYEAIDLSLSFVESRQHDNGSFDYETCNFKAAPDTAFIMKKMLPVRKYLAEKGTEIEEKQVLNRLDTILKKGVQALLEGGFHTPNHRWAIASVLAICYKTYGIEACKTEAEKYLVEGIDCDVDGEFAERSVGNYNKINDEAMVMLSEGLNNQEYELHAIRNLESMSLYFEPDDSIFTANSTRFDKDLKVFPRYYYWLYLSLGFRYDRKDFIAMAIWIMSVVEKHQLKAPDFLIYFMNHPELIEFESRAELTKDKRIKLFEESGTGRYLEGNMSCTVLRDKSNAIYIHNGDFKVEVKLAGSFFEHRAFKAQTIELKEDGTFLLRQKMKGWYYLPFETYQGTNDWWQMDQSKRPKKAGPDLDLLVSVKPSKEKVDIGFKVEGVMDAPFRVELAFEGIDKVETAYFAMPVTGAEGFVVKEGFLTASTKRSSMTVGPAFGEHNFILGKEDSDVKNPGCATAYFTAYTPFEKNISITLNN